MELESVRLRCPHCKHCWNVDCPINEQDEIEIQDDVCPVCGTQGVLNDD